MDRILNVKNISKSYKIGSTKVLALKSTTLEIKKGEIVVVIGKSGSGKSTLLNILGGLIVPDSGEVMLDGTNLYGLSEKERAKIRNQKCGFIYQNFNLINELSVINNIRLPFDIAGKPYNIKREKELLDILDLGKRRNFYPAQLSGGERQRTAVARALLMEPSIILADEPTGNLDLESGNKLMAFVKRTNREQGQTYVIVTHDLEWLKIAHIVYRMSDGRLEQEVQK
ncbi:MAG: ABC transporter ATP-binding protein [Lachnospiraceae bacterium]|nr:ABC transporter ATP-binding protein [Lachnospiraceae bacterium]